MNGRAGDAESGISASRRRAGVVGRKLVTFARIVAMQAIILSIGDELVLGQSVDTNSGWLAARLSRLGIYTLYHQTVSDDREAIAGAIVSAMARARLVLITGGLGPTEDDLTRQALADALDQPMVTDGASLEQIEQFFARRGRPMPPRNRVQARLPRHARPIVNPNGTAPGICAQHRGVWLYVMPGVPIEMRAMFERSIQPELVELVGDRQVILAAKVNTFGAGESAVAERLGDLMDRGRNPKVGTTVAGGIVSVRVRSEFASRTEAEDALQKTVRAIEQRLGPIVFGKDDERLEDALVGLLAEQGKRVVTAESCTGGLIGSMLTHRAGASEVYLGGWVTYANEMKVRQLGVDPAALQGEGAVSQAVAEAMARSALERSEADLSVAVTGIAGPGGGSDTKPVGMVYLSIGAREGDGIAVQTRELRLPGDREAVRDRAAKCGLQMLRFYLLNEPLAQIN